MLDQIFQSLRKNQIVIALLAVFVAFLAYQAALMIVIFFVAFVLSVVLLPPVDFLIRHKFPRSIAVLTISFGLLLIAVTFGYLLFPPLIVQMSQLVNRIPEIVQHIPFLSGLHFNGNLLSFLQTQVTNFQEVAISFTTTFVTFLGAIIAIVVLTIYLLADYPHIRESVTRQFGEKKELGNGIFFRLENKLGGWLRGQLLLSLVVAIMFLIAYLVIGLPAAIPLAIIAGIFEIIPVLGPTLAAIPAALIAITVSFKLFIVVLVVYAIVQIIESHALAPRIMSRSAHLHPVVIIFALLVGGELAGFLGILLAVPIMLFLVSIYEAVKESHKLSKKIP